MKSLVVRCLVVLLIFGGCDVLSLDKKSGGLVDLIQRNREEWQEGGIDSYIFAYNKTIGDNEQNDVRVVVQESAIDTVSIQGEGVEDPGDEFLTVSRLYDEIVRNFEREDRGSFQVNFDEELSYPRRYRMLPGESTKGRGVVVTSFEVVEQED